MGADHASQLVDAENGFISRELFVDPDLYKQEVEKLFTRAWLFVGHESQIPNPGDFFVSKMGTESVILCRDKAKEIHVFLNSCRHRGMRVCRYEQGNTSLFTCPYHSWTYGTDGRLQGVPLYRDLYDGVLDRSQFSLVHVPKMANYKGAIFATWDAEAPDFITYLGEARQHLDTVLDCRDGREGGAEVIGVQKWIFPANWKFAAENFLGDSYHNPSHRSVDMIGIGPNSQSGKGRRDDTALNRAQHVWISFPEGHGVHSALAPSTDEHDEVYQDPIVDEYFRHCHEERRRRGKDKLLGFTGTLFPNCSYHARQPRNLCLWHPHGTTSTEGWRFFLVDADAPAAVKDYMRRYYMRYSGPAGMTEQDDIENWLYATAASSGPIARRHPFNYQQSLRDGRTDGPLPGNLSTKYTEQNARGFYTRWASYLNGDDWNGLLGRKDGGESQRVAAE